MINGSRVVGVAGSLVVKVTAGLDAPERCSQAFTVAASAVASGVDVSVWLTGESAWFSLPGRAADFELPHAAPLTVPSPARCAPGRRRPSQRAIPSSAPCEIVHHIARTGRTIGFAVLRDRTEVEVVGGGDR